MSQRTDLQKIASSHNWEIYKLRGMRNQLNWFRDRCATLTDESRKDVNEVIDKIDILLTSMRVRRDQLDLQEIYRGIPKVRRIFLSED